MNGKITVVLLLGCLASVAYGAGTNSAEFLMLGHGARADGLSGAYTAVSDDSNSMYWNAAGLSGIRRTQVSFSYNSWIADISQQYISAGIPVTGAGVAGVSVEYVNLGAITGRRSQTSQQYNFNANDMQVGLAYARPLTAGLSAGVALKFIQETIDDVKAAGIAFDLGLKEEIGRNIKVGAVLRNAGSGIKYVNKTEKLPTMINVGVAYALGGIQVAFDVKRQADTRDTEISIGTEFAVFDALNLRGGMFKLNSYDSSMQYMFSGGLGLKLGKNSIDYAFTPVGDFGPTHKVSLAVKF